MTVRDALSTLLMGGGEPLVVLDAQQREKGRFSLELVGGLLGPGHDALPDGHTEDGQ
jgi:hypothetical protein